ncbi:MAG: twin-arginine translocation signal domain-containing protein, partial [Elusimicrobia bacterium]|nr:twin-arginine translocation signal domain-containing protein [Elusimicrobiota bacterium]
MEPLKAIFSQAITRRKFLKMSGAGMALLWANEPL